jgi:hypothetical protein
MFRHFTGHKLCYRADLLGSGSVTCVRLEQCGGGYDIIGSVARTCDTGERARDRPVPPR